MASMDRTPLEEALAYSNRGWPVFPLKTGEKTPAIKGWQQEATTNPEQIQKWGDQFPDANYGMRTGEASGILAVDVDPRNDGDETFQALEKEHGSFPTTVEVLTGGGGRHLYFAITPEQSARINARANALGPGVDVKGNGGYVVIPGSIHPDTGKAYIFSVDGHPDDVELSPVPEWILERLQGKPQRSSVKGKMTEVEQIRGGNRNNHLTSLAGSMRRPGMSAAAIEAALLVENRKRCIPPLPEDEVKTIATSVARYEPGGAANYMKTNDEATKTLSEFYPKVSRPDWPDPPDKAAFYGLAGEFVNLVDPISEADPVAVLIQFLAAYGSVVGRSAYFIAEQTKHHMNLFTVIIGRTSKARKGSSWSHVLRVFQRCDSVWASDCMTSGLSSGEGLIWQVRDAIYKKEPEKDTKGKKTGKYIDVVDDPGVADKRLLVQESEFSTVLRMTDRQGNTLSAIIRRAWETGELKALTKNSPAKATGAHITIIGHIVKDEVRRYLSRTETGNGFANRYLWVCAKRSKIISDDIPPDAVNWDSFVNSLRQAIQFGRSTSQLRRDEEAQELWRDVYPILSEGAPGLFGAVTSRGEAQVMRLACLYALLDNCAVIKAVHLRAALALWEYSEASARFIFGEALGDPIADEVYDALRMNPEGLTRTQISELFGRNKSRDDVGRALATLLELGRVQMIEVNTGGRRAERWKAI